MFSLPLTNIVICEIYTLNISFTPFTNNVISKIYVPYNAIEMVGSFLVVGFGDLAEVAGSFFAAIFG